MNRKFIRLFLVLLSAAFFFIWEIVCLLNTVIDVYRKIIHLFTVFVYLLCFENIVLLQ